jgi:hypothetical protein
VSFRAVRVRMEYTVHVPDSVPEDQTVQVAIEAEIPHTLHVDTTGQIVGAFVAPCRGAFVVKVPR